MIALVFSPEITPLNWNRPLPELPLVDPPTPPKPMPMTVLYLPPDKESRNERRATRRLARRSFRERRLAEQLEDGLRRLVRLGQHRGARLLEDLLVGELDHHRRHVRVLDLGFRRRQVLAGRVQVVDRVLETVLVGAEV